MLYMIFGGSGSGKSAYAEDLAVKLCPEEKVYLATLTDIDEEMERRIQDHRRMREGKNFRTVEQGLSLETLDLSGERLVLLECMTNLLANELYSPQGAGDDAVESIRRGIHRLHGQCEELVVVSNEVFSGGCGYEGDTRRYMRVLAEVNRMLASCADTVYEVVCGVPVCHKGRGRGR